MLISGNDYQANLISQKRALCEALRTVSDQVLASFQTVEMIFR